jgi:hypothetical protein
VHRASVALILVTMTSLAADLDTGALLESLVRPAPERTPFVEVRYSALLSEPIFVTGELEHRTDGALVRRVESPYRETTELHEENVRVEREGSKPRRFSLDRAPELRGMLASFGALLTGDRETLERNFVVAAQGDTEHWTLELSPRDERLKRRLSSIRVDGRQDRPRCLTLAEPDGDASVMALGVRDRAELPASLERASLRAWCSGQSGP